jgi:hypothetical protein
MRIAALIPLVLLTLACGEDDLTLELSIPLGSCEVSDLSEVEALSVEVWGFEADGRPCAMAARCIPVPENMNSLDDLYQVLQDQPQPLVDTERSSSPLLYLKGHNTKDCFIGENVSMCGFGSIDGSGVIELPLDCGACPNSMDVRLCVEPMQL